MIYIPFGQVTAPFRGYSRRVAQQVGHQHTGVDTVRGYGTPTIAKNRGYVYKVYKPDEDFNWAAVHMLVPHEETPDMEYEWVPLGHASEIFVSEGDVLQPGDVVGKTGNHGEVYSRGRLVTREEKQNGSRDGTHNHELVRPVRKVKNIDRGKHYLRMQDGSPYLGNDGCYRLIINENDTKGCVDPMSFKPKLSQRIRLVLQDAAAQEGTTIDKLNVLKVSGHVLLYIGAFIRQFTRLST